MTTPKRQEVELTKIRITTEYGSEESYAEESNEPLRPDAHSGRDFSKRWNVFLKLSGLCANLLSLIEKLRRDC